MDDADTLPLHNTWVQATGPHAADLLQPILDAYRAPGRHYHNLHHINACLTEFRRVESVAAEARAVTVALIFHDAVYDPTRTDNEERSADRAGGVLRAAGAVESFSNDVTRLILATKHGTEPPPEGDAALVADIDLSILGQPESVFDAYEEAIRREYAHVPDAAFAAGRAKVLRHFLDRPSIYATPALRERYGAAARRNLRRSLTRWTVNPAGE